MIKKILALLFLFVIPFLTSGYVNPDVYKIDASKNAVEYNNLGLKYSSEGNYFSAIENFKTAIELSPKTQASAVYYNNLGETYMAIGCYTEAQHSFENAVNKYNLNFLYYQNLVKSYKARGIIASKIKYYQSKEENNSLEMIILGLLYVSSGDIRRGIIKLDEFCMKEPNLIITAAVKNYIQIIIPKN